MGVTKLWTIVEDAGKPIRLETLRKKRLAIDASIWVYQFLKAVRNKEGQGLTGSHIVGFFRRICKLLYHGVLPIFVFDGGAPLIKLNTIARRRERREGQRQSAKGTAQKLLQMKLQKEAEKHVQKSKEIKPKAEDDIVKEGTYFRKEDDYHLPELDKFYHKKTDKRVLSPDDYQKYMESLDDDIEDVDLNNIDPASDEFNELSLEKQYKILHRLRLRSRLRMGYSKEQLQNIFPNSLDFSKFQIQMVTKRNFLTQRLLNVVGLDDSLPDIDSVSSTRRVAGENDKAYTIQRSKNGWSLSLDDEGTKMSNPIKLDEDEENAKPLPKKRKLELKKKEFKDEEDDDDDFSDGEFEDVKIEVRKPRQNFSLNALPLPPASEQQLQSSTLSHGAFFSLNETKSKPKLRSDYQEVDDALYSHAVENSKAEEERQYDEELKKAIELSKKELEQLRKDQEDFLEADPFEFQTSKDNATIAKPTEPKKFISAPSFNPPKLSLGKSIFSKSKSQQEKETPQPSVQLENEEIPNKPGRKNDIDDEKTAESEKKPSNEMPSWFEGTTKEPFKDIHSTQFASVSVKPVQKKKGDESDVLIENFHYGEDENTFESQVGEEEENDDDQQVIELADRSADGQVIEINDDDDDDDRGAKEVIEVPSADTSLDSTTSDKDRFPAPDESSVVDKAVQSNSVNDAPKVTDFKNKQIVPKKKKTEAVVKPIIQKPRISNAEAGNEPVEVAVGKDAEKAPKPIQEPIETETSATIIAPVTDTIATKQDKTALENTQNKVLYYDFDEAEEEELAEDLQREEQAHAEFAENLREQYKPTSAAPSAPFVPSGLRSSGGFNYNEANLRAQQKRELRDSDEVTDVMIEECKDLLTCFGIPYITAPMEAEAQCAKLFQLNLIDGIVTDDSDCFLFGGSRIYRHMFTEKKFAEFYETDDIMQKVKLSRDQLIDLAYLLGSDYTEGLKGIGPVIAVKILNEFENLQKFRDWCVECQKLNANDKNSEKWKELCNTAFKKSLRKRLISNEVYLDHRFPDPNVRNSYLFPEVDEDKTEFVWGAPDLDMLRNYLMTKIGWSKEKINQILIPLIRRYNSPW